MTTRAPRRHAIFIAGIPPAVTEPFEFARALERLVADHRRALGLSPAPAHRTLAVAATSHSERMRRLGFFDHRDPHDGTHAYDRVTAVDAQRWTLIAENLAAGQWNARQVLDGWLDSPGHRRNLEWPGLNAIGTSVVTGGDLRTYTTQVYGTRPRHRTRRFQGVPD